ncbi:unnamed protein product [Rhizopus microsporus]
MATILLLLNYESLKLFYFFQVSNMSSLKRRAPIDEQEDEKPLKRSHKQTEEEEEQDSDDGLQEVVDVDFDFYNPDEIDFHALKKLLTQLFSSDAELINLSDLADI